MNIESSSSARCSMMPQSLPDSFHKDDIFHDSHSIHSVDSPWVKAKQIQEKLPCEMKKNLKFKIKYIGKEEKESNFKKGEIVEVTSEDEGYKGVWFVAIIIDAIEKDRFIVEYKNLIIENGFQPLKEEINLKYIRPCPPEVPVNGSFKNLQEVDAWHNNGWWEGLIIDLVSKTECFARFMNNEILRLECSQLRPHQDWIDGKWIIPFKESSELVKKFGTKFILKRSIPYDNVEKSKYAKKTTIIAGGKVEFSFFKGEKVEVKSDEEGYEGSWYTATIIDHLKNTNYLVEYLTLKTNDLLKQLREEAVVSDIRPYPPEINHFCQFVPHEKVDVWFNDGWWEGVLSSVVHCSNGNVKYNVYFGITDEELEFEHCDMRPHQEWIGGRWSLG